MHFFLLKKYLRYFYRHTPVLYNVQNVHLSRIEIAQYRDKPSQKSQIKIKIIKKVLHMLY